MNNALVTLNHRWGRVKEFIAYAQPKDFWVDANLYPRRLTKSFIEDVMREELIQYTQTSPYQRTLQPRIDSRNGYYYRDLDTTIGSIENIAVPRSRHGLFKPTVFQRYQRRQEAVNQIICNTFLRGISTRDAAGALRPALGFEFSASTVSRITKRLDKNVKEFHNRKLLDEYQFLFLDGITISVKGALKAKKILVLVAYGITLFGKKELMAFRIAGSESGVARESFLDDLFRRGFEGKNLKLIITDGSKGFIHAIGMVYAHALRQRCWVNALRNATKTLRKNDLPDFKKDAARIYNASSHRNAVRQFRRLKNKWFQAYPKAVRRIEKDLDSLLAFLTIPIKEQHRIFIRRQIRTTNIIERSFREVRRRTRPMSCFKNTDSVQRVIYAIFSKLNAKWEANPLDEFTQFI